MKTLQKLSELLSDFFNSKSDASGSIEASQQEALENEYSRYIEAVGPEVFICECMHDMCVESLSPELYEKWESVCNELYRVRRELMGAASPIKK